MTTSALHEIPGGEALIDWFGQVPAFHDADVMAINLVSNGTSVLNFWTWRMTDKVDAQGYFEIEKHIFVDIVLREVTYVSLCQFQLPGIIFQLHITRSGDEFESVLGGKLWRIRHYSRQTGERRVTARHTAGAYRRLGTPET